MKISEIVNKVTSDSGVTLKRLSGTTGLVEYAPPNNLIVGIGNVFTGRVACRNDIAAAITQATCSNGPAPVWGCWFEPADNYHEQQSPLVGTLYIDKVCCFPADTPTRILYAFAVAAVMREKSVYCTGCKRCIWLRSSQDAEIGVDAIADRTEYGLETLVKVHSATLDCFPDMPTFEYSSLVCVGRPVDVEPVPYDCDQRSEWFRRSKFNRPIKMAAERLLSQMRRIACEKL